MDKILFVDDDLAIHRIFDASLSTYKDDFQIVHAGDGEKAIVELERDDISAVVTDMVMPGMDGFTLVNHLVENYPETPCIVMTSYDIPGLEEKMLGKAYTFLKKPVRPALLAQTIKGALRQASMGTGLGSMSVPGIMQLIESEGKSCLVDIHQSEKKEGMMVFQQGVLFDAKCGSLIGEEAALRLIAMDNVRANCRKLPSKNIVRRINKTAQNLILHGVQMKDEGKSVKPKKKRISKEELLKEGIGLCRRLQNREAQVILKKVIAADTENSLAWLWISRTLVDMRMIQRTLKEAHRLDPKNGDVLWDIEKVRSALKADVNKITRCPFCYAPTDFHASQCHFCEAYIVVDINILRALNGSVNRAEMVRALKRFDEILTTELNNTILFYAGLGCLNIGDMDKAAKYLQQLKAIGPDENSRYDTVEMMLDFLDYKRMKPGSAPQEGWKGKNGKTLPQRKVIVDQPGVKTVLVVDDSATTRSVIKRTFQESSYSVIEAGDGLEALAVLKKQKPDLILLDVMMPKLDGYDVLRLLKKEDALKDIPVIMLTGKKKIHDKIKGHLSAADAYLTKPFKPEKLIAQVSKYIER